MPRIDLDIDVLRTLVAAQLLGGFTRAADHVGRSQAAVSQQIHKLEDRIGLPLFRKRGRHLVPTEAGELLLGYARRILELNDEAVAALRGVAVDGSVRFGMPADFAETWLPSVLGRFRRAHPTVRIEATADRNAALLERLARGQLDLALLLGPEGPGEVLGTLPMVWIAVPGMVPDLREPVPLVAFDAPCAFRNAATAALDAAGIAWRVEFTSPSLSGVWAAVKAGLGLTVRTMAGLPAGLAPVASGLPKLPEVRLSLDGGGRPLAPAALRLREVLVETFPLPLAAMLRKM